MKRDLLYVAALAVSVGLAGPAAGQVKTQAEQFQEAERARQAEKQAQQADQGQTQAEKADRADRADKKQKQQQQRIKRQNEQRKADAAAAAAANANATEPAAGNVAAAPAAAANAAAAQAPADAAAAPDAKVEPVATLPAGLRGFNGTFSGIVVRADKDGEHFVLRPRQVVYTSPQSKASDAQGALYGLAVTVYPGLESHGDPEQQRQWIRSLHANREGADNVQVDVKDVDGKLRINALTPEAQRETQKFAGAAQDTPLPEGLRGFDGTLSGIVVSADQGGEYFVLRPRQVLHTSPRSTASNAQAALHGLRVTIYPGQNPHGDPELQRQWIRSLHANREGDDNIPVDVKDVDGKLRINVLTPEAQQAAAKLAPEQPKAKDPASN